MVADVEYAHSRVLIGGKDQFRADETARPVLVDIVRAEVAALVHVVRLRRRREGGNAHGISLYAVIEHPDELEAIFLMIQNGFIEHGQQIAVGQRQAIVGAATERRRPVPLGDQLGLRAVGDIDHHHAGVAPGGIGGVAVHDRMVQSIAAGRRP